MDAERPDDDDDEWEDVETITRMPKGARPGASSRSEGFNRGPVITETGERAQPEWMVKSHAPAVDPALEPAEPSQGGDRPPISDWVAKLIADVFDEMIRRGARAASKALKPRLHALWHDRIVPGVSSRWARLTHGRSRGPKKRRGAGSGPASGTAAAEIALVVSQDSGSMSVEEALERLDGAQALRVLSDHLRALSDEERRAVVTADIDEPEARRAAEALTPEQITQGMRTEMQRNPRLLGDIARHIHRPGTGGTRGR